MRDSIEDIVRYYETNSEDTRFNRQQLELAVTSRVLKYYLPQPCRVLELGAGSGRFSAELALAGHDLTSIELVPSLMEQSAARLETLGISNRAKLLVGDARDASKLVRGPFDAILCMGPLYHLVQAEDRTNLIRDAHALLQPNGTLMATHMTRVGIVGYMLTRFPTWITDAPEQFAEIMTEGRLASHPPNGDFRGYFSSLEEIHDLHSQSGFADIRMHSQDPCIASVDEVFNRLPGPLKEQWAEALFAVSGDPLALGSGRSVICLSKRA